MEKEKKPSIIIRFFKKLDILMPPVCLFLVTFCIYMPCSLFLGNANEFVISFTEVYPLVIKVSAVVLAGLVVLGYLLVPRKVFRVFTTLLFGVSLGFYVQGNFMNPNMGLLNGKSINWNDYMTYIIVGTIIWVICIIVPFVLLIIKPNIANLLMKWLSYALCAMQAVSLAVTLLTAPVPDAKKSECSTALFDKDEFVLSNNENTLVFLVDTLDAEYYESIIESNPEYQDMLKDFTYYDNCITGAAPTVAAVPCLLTGQRYTNLENEDFIDYQIRSYEESTLFKDMKANNYRVNLFTYSDFAIGATVDEVDNMKGYDKFIITSEEGFTKTLYKFTAFYAMPVILKNKFWFYSDDFNQYTGVIDENYNEYKFDDSVFYNKYKNDGLSYIDDKNVFSFYHLKGCHQPYELDENMQPDENSTLEKQTEGIFNMIDDFISKLKDKGVYDSSTIIITADHGQLDIYQNGAVLVKKKNEHKEYSTNSAPVMFDNLRATIAVECGADASSYCETLDEVPNEQRNRYHTIHMIGKDVFPDNKEASGHDFSHYLFTGDAKDMSKMTILNWNEKENTDEKK